MFVAVPALPDGVRTYTRIVQLALFAGGVVDANWICVPPEGAVSVPTHALAAGVAATGEIVWPAGRSSVIVKLAHAGALFGRVTVIVSSESVPAGTVDGENAFDADAGAATTSVPEIATRFLIGSPAGGVPTTPFTAIVLTRLPVAVLLNVWTGKVIVQLAPAASDPPVNVIVFEFTSIDAVIPQSFVGAGEAASLTPPGPPPIVELTLSTKPKLVSATPLSFFRTTVARLPWPWNTVAGANDFVPVILLVGCTTRFAVTLGYGKVPSQVPARISLVSVRLPVPALVAVTLTRIVHCAGFAELGAATSDPPETAMLVPSAGAVTENPDATVEVAYWQSPDANAGCAGLAIFMPAGRLSVKPMLASVLAV